MLARWRASFVILLAAAPAVVVLLGLAGAWLTPAGDTLQHQWRYLLPDAARNTLILVMTVALGAALLGTALAALVALYEFPGRAFFSWSLLLPLSIPGYVLAAVFAGSLDYSSPLYSWLREQFGWQWPSIRSLGGAALVLMLTLFPYVYLIARVAFESAAQRYLEAASLLGRTRRQATREVLLPLVLPAVLAATALVAMETLADFGVVAALNVDTLTTALYRAWYGMFSLVTAQQVAGLLVLAALLLLALEHRARSWVRVREASGPVLQRRPLPALTAALATLFASSILGISFAWPVMHLLSWASAHLTADLDARYWGYFVRSLMLAGLGALLIVSISTLFVYARRNAVGRIARVVAPFATAGYAIPGAVLAVGLFAPMTQALPWLQGTLFVLFVAYITRFFAVGHAPIAAGLARLPTALDESALLLGSRPLERWQHIHWPLLKGSVAAAFVLTFVDLMKELPITLLTRPFGFETLAIRVFELTSEGEWERAAVPALALVLAGLWPLKWLAGRMPHAT
ncbi:MAG: iron ABC transporter permease [Gammaproteobacteria bacterium]|nr:iron ABC transporter permease [Gammaproteobacteria bacterium]